MEVLRKATVEVLWKVLLLKMVLLKMVLWMRLAGWVLDAELLLKRRGDVIWEANTEEEEEEEEEAELLLKRR